MREEDTAQRGPACGPWGRPDSQQGGSGLTSTATKNGALPTTPTSVKAGLSPALHTLEFGLGSPVLDYRPRELRDGRGV